MAELAPQSQHPPAVIQPDWPAPKRVRALVTTRQGGVSKPPFESWNMGDHVQDDEDAVAHNRKLLNPFLPKNSQVCWLQQVHGVELVEATSENLLAQADASHSQTLNQACAIMTADCLPVLLCDLDGTQVAAAHAGWRGLANGVLLKTLASFDRADKVIAWMGPAISQAHFEVGQEVKEAFADYPQAFVPSGRDGHFLADLYEITRQQLLNAGINAVYGGEYCSYKQDELWFSYRRATHQGIDKSATGRMVSCIWLQDLAD